MPDVSFDYDKIAHRYDKFRGGGGPYLPVLAALAEACQAKHPLEIGAGTGNNTIAFQEFYPRAELTACDLSVEMIRQARQKDAPGAWVQADAMRLPFASGVMDFVFGCYMLHYIADLETFLGECRRVLRAGYAGFATASHEFIDNHPMNRYFPSFADVDRNRFQPVDAVKNALSGADFADIGEERIVAPPRPIDADYLKRVENHFISTYSLLPEEEFREGLAKLRADIEAKGSLDVDIEWESVVVWGRKDAS